jgi:hypothetical protein
LSATSSPDPIATITVGGGAFTFATALSTNWGANTAGCSYKYLAYDKTPITTSHVLYTRNSVSMVSGVDAATGRATI